MRRLSFILMVLLFPFVPNAQVVFKAIVSRQVVTVGESFQIQYVLDDLEKDNEFAPPVFNGLRIVSGPYTYTGSIKDNNGSAHLKNIVFTLVAIKPGRYIIPGASAKANGKIIKSDDVIIDVITKREALERAANKEKNDPSEYFLRPGEDPYEKMRKNLFMKVLVDRTNCYVGEPVVATFKLYSRLESKSDIVKNPGFYGFTVHDIANLNDNITSTEVVNGKAFYVHIVRIVQLYPLQPGQFTIDPIEVTNKVEFSKSVVNKKTEQEIIEGVIETPESPTKSNTVTYENHISTQNIAINVKPYPSTNRPPAFNGATGSFMITMSIEKNELAKNEEGMLIVTITGKGNFTQLPAPVIQWPGDIEAFEPIIKDSLDKTRVPLKGSRTFRFPFIIGKPGNYHIPSISFSFFDPDSNHFRTVSADPIGITIGNEEKKQQPTEQRAMTATGKSDHSTAWLYGCIFCVVLVIILLQLRTLPKEQIATEEVIGKIEAAVSTAELLKPVQFSLVADDGMFYILLQKSIWEQLANQLNLSGSRINKDELYKVMKEKNLEQQYHAILEVLQECEAAVFTRAELMHDKQELLNRARAILVEIKA